MGPEKECRPVSIVPEARTFNCQCFFIFLISFPIIEMEVDLVSCLPELLGLAELLCVIGMSVKYAFVSLSHSEDVWLLLQQNLLSLAKLSYLGLSYRLFSRSIL